MRAVLTALALFHVASFANAQETGGASIMIELNTLQPAEGGCQLTFVTSTTHTRDIEKLVFETVLFTTEGAVERLTLFDFGAIPAHAPRVRQFVLPQLECADLGQLLFNGVNVCEVNGTEETSCATGLALTSRTDVELLG
ncbi:hypothetical protein SLH49_21110 [Cognatiyoonia sp. IB215446]|uniref:hypothetical protein n=1 Tax=Cognatiyoonia sp. IB215446 TaxID=3097355 RepID=UPI002A0CFA7A|nr:hypothetical protein [Cognatiyoonia sp. IB215446]MDX8350497.1 hypothetical protein [Cognatiyoonia sp. IB215446]